MAEYLIQDTTLTAIGNAIRSKEGSSGTIQVSEFASRISAIQTGVTVQRKTGTFTTSKDNFSVDIGFQPDLVLLHAGEDDGENYFHAAAAFHEDPRGVWNVKIQMPSADGYYMFYIRPTYAGFTGSAWKVDSNFSWNSFSTPITYSAVKYT